MIEFPIPKSVNTVRISDVSVSYTDDGPFLSLGFHRLGGYLKPLWQERHLIIHKWCVLRFDSEEDAFKFRLADNKSTVLSTVRGVLFLREISEIRICDPPVAPSGTLFCLALKVGDNYEFVAVNSQTQRQSLAASLAAGRDIIKEGPTPSLTGGSPWFRRGHALPWSQDPTQRLKTMGDSDFSIHEWQDVLPRSPSSDASTDLPAQPANMSAFDELLRDLSGAAFASDRATVLQAYVEQQPITPDQLARLIRQIPYKEEKLSTLRLFAPKVRDADDKSAIIDAFVFPEDKASAEEILAASE